MCLEESRRGPGPPLMVSGNKEEGGRGQTKRVRRGSGAGGRARPRLNLGELRGLWLHWREEDNVCLV